jgi:SAM-dependent methyltransferase
MSFVTILKDCFSALIDPWLFMSISARHIPITIRQLILTRDYQAFFSLSKFCDALFGQFWVTVGPQVKSGAEARVIPLLEGRVAGGEVHNEIVGTPLSGTVIEIGAGSGMWADVFAQIRTGTEDHVNDPIEVRHRRKKNNLTKIYGIEPNPVSAAALRQRVAEVGLDDIYEVVPAGIEDLATQSAIEPGTIDCIVCILCLCSIPDQQENIRALYKLLKPGGRWYVYEHVKADRSGVLMSIYQRKLWPFTSARTPD